MSADSAAAAGTMRAFLRDHTLIMDSCWETYRLTRWELQEADSTLTWNEDGMDVTAKIVEAGPSLRLRLQLVGEDIREEHYEAAEVPYLCPDMPR